MINNIIRLNLALSISVLPTLAMAQSSSNNYVQLGSSFDSGGGSVQSNTYSGQTSIGQIGIVGRASSNKYSSTVGFFSAQESTQIRIIAATYDVANGQLVVTGANFTTINGTANDIDASTLTFTGENNQRYTLTDSADVEIDSSTQFTLTLSETDQLNIEGLLNKDGEQADDNTVYNLAVDHRFNGDNSFADETDNPITVSNVQTPTVSSVSYNSTTGVLTLTGSHFVKNSGANNDVAISQLTIRSNNNTTQSLTNTSDIEINSSTSISIALATTDKTNIDALFNNGDSSYSLIFADNWLTGVANSTDLTNSIGVIINITNKDAPTHYPTNLTPSTDGLGTITVTWDKPTTGILPTGYLVACSTTTNTPPTNGVIPTADNDCSDGSGVQYIVHSDPSRAIWSGLNMSTNYQFEIYPYTNDSTDRQYKTDGTSPNIGVIATQLQPEINVTGNSIAISSNDTSPRSLDHTDFGEGTSNITRTFTIENTGQAPLLLNGSPVISLLHDSNNHFSASIPNSTNIAVGASTTFTITLNPPDAGISTATLVIANNDNDENPYTFNIQGGEASDPIAPRAEKLRAYLASDTDKHALQKFQNTGGNIRFAFDLVDSDNGTYTYTWSSSNTTLDALINNLGGSISDGTVTSSALDISSLAAGKYPITVSVSDSTFTTDQNYTAKAEYTLEVVTAAVSNDDSNRDDDGDGVSNAHDNKPNEANNVPARLSNQANYESKVETGYRITLGETAKAAQRTGLKVSTSDLANHGNDGSNATNTDLSSKTLDHVFDYVVEGVPVSNPNTGTSIRVVLPLEIPLAANSTFHKYDANGGWADFTANANNVIEWADWEGGQQGVCPDPDSASYNNTAPQTGKTCLRMTIQDGGDNDQDGNVNGRIVDPLGIATPTPSTGGGNSSGGSNDSGNSSSCLQLEGVPSNTDQITENPQECSGGGYKTHYFLVELGEALTVDASVSYTTLDGTAIAGEDYVAASGTATIPAGQRYVAIPVQLINDNVAEPDETFSLIIRDPVGGVFPVGMTEIIATHVIRDDDRSGSAYLEAQPSQSHHVIKRPLEGDQNYTHYFLLELNQAPTQTAQVNYKTESGTAIADQDFIAAEGTITIPAGQTHALIGVTLIGDQSDEDDETFSVVVTDPKGGNFPDGVTELRSTHTIVDDD